MTTSSDSGAMPSPRPRRRRRVLVALGVVLVLLVGASVLGYTLTLGRYDRNMERAEDVIDEKATDRPTVPTNVEAQNWLVVGSDSRSKDGTSGKHAKGDLWKPGMQRTDTMMLVHLAGDGEQISVTSLPRDTWVDIPGHGKGKLNAAFSYGGPRLLVRTVERLSEVRIDHYAAIDFAGFKSMTDAVDGVDVTVPRTVRDCSNGTLWEKGRHHLGGAAALKYVRQRCGLPNGDLDRIRRQQGFLLALLNKARSHDVLTNPKRLDGFLDATTESITVDDSVKGGELRSLGFRYRNADAGDLTFLTLPIRSYGMIGGQSVLLLDERKSEKLFTALRKDRVEKYVKSGAGDANQVRRPS